MFDFTCEACGKASPANAWNKATITMYQGDCEILPEHPDDKDPSWKDCVHCCPECEAEVSIDQDEIDSLDSMIMAHFLDKYKIESEDAEWLRSLL